MKEIAEHDSEIMHAQDCRPGDSRLVGARRHRRVGADILCRSYAGPYVDPYPVAVAPGGVYVAPSPVIAAPPIVRSRPVVVSRRAYAPAPAFAAPVPYDYAPYDYARRTSATFPAGETDHRELAK